MTDNSQKSYRWGLLIVLFILLSGCFPGFQPVKQEPEVFYRDVTPVVSATPSTAKTPASAPDSTQTPFSPDENNPLIKLAWFHNPVYDAEPDVLASNYDLFILTRTDEQFRDSLKALGSKAKFLMFIGFESIHNPGSCTEQPWLNQAAYKVGDFCDIRDNHPDWFLLDTGGNQVILKWEDQQFYFMDPANEGWQNFLIDRIRQMRQTNGWDGVFMDNMDASLGRFTRNGIQLAKYPDNISLQKAHTALLVKVRNELAGPGKFPLFANITYLEEPAVFYQYMQYLDGAMIEDFAVDWTFYHSPTTWLSQMDFIEKAQKYGRKFILVAQGTQNDNQRQVFALASYLLINNGNLYFRYTNQEYYRYSWLYENYEIQLGSPLGMRYQSQGFWQRDFEHGQVRVNPVTHEAAIELK
jgi:hypothetical protein